MVLKSLISAFFQTVKRGYHAKIDMWNCIKCLAVRGAPLIGCAAALQVGVLAESGASSSELSEACHYLISARPTAVNLEYCCQQILHLIDSTQKNHSPNSVHSMTPLNVSVPQLAYDLLMAEVQMNAKMAEAGSSLISDGDGILTHCNTGSLATPGLGTALGVIKHAYQSGKKKIHVYVDETRPLLQGGRLTTYELKQAKIPYTLICDNMAAVLMNQKKIHKVFVGADRIARNGDFANKIGTYTVAITAKFHSIPFYVCAPLSTVDMRCQSGAEIPVEERKEDEVRGFGSTRWAPCDSPVFNPAFDVTPSLLVNRFIFDCGQVKPDELEKYIPNKKSKTSPN